MVNPILPKAQSHISETSRQPSREWYEFFRRLLEFIQESGADPGVIASILQRLDELEEDDGSFFINGLMSINVAGTPDAGVVNISLDGDVELPGNTYYYGTGPTGTKGFFTVASAISAGTGITKAVAGTGVTTIAHADTSSVANLTSDNSGAVVLQDITFTFDTFGHVQTATVGTVNLNGGQITHNTLGGLQGGTTGEYYHLTSAQNTAVVNATSTGGGFVTIAGSQTVTGQKTFTQPVICQTTVSPAFYQANSPGGIQSFLSSNDTLGVGIVGTLSAHPLGFFASSTRFMNLSATGTNFFPQNDIFTSLGDATHRWSGLHTNGLTSYALMRSDGGDSRLFMVNGAGAPTKAASLNFSTAGGVDAQGVVSIQRRTTGDVFEANLWQLFLSTGESVYGGNVRPVADNFFTCGTDATGWAAVYAHNGIFGPNSPSLGGGSGLIFLSNATTSPTSNPTGGVLMYAEAGAAKVRGASGTVTTFGPAAPHCPECGSDFVHEWENTTRGYGYLAVCMNCFVDGVNSHTRVKGDWTE